MLKVSRSDMVKLFEALDYFTSSKWNAKKMRKQLAQLMDQSDLEEIGFEDEGLNMLFQKLLDESTSEDGEVKIVRDEEIETEPAGEAEEGGGIDDSLEDGTEPLTEDELEAIEDVTEPDVADRDEPRDESGMTGEAAGPEEEVAIEKVPGDEEAEVPSKEKKTRKKKAKPTKKGTKLRGVPGPKVGKNEPKGIRSIRNRLFYAGAILKQHGIQDGLTDELITKVDKLIGKENLIASKAQLGLAWHVINGYLNG